MAQAGQQTAQGQQEQHQQHGGEHAHVHNEMCGHESRKHGDHTDYEHDGHWHAKHGDHYDEHDSGSSDPPM